jgi:hypothetical protein
VPDDRRADLVGRQRRRQRGGERVQAGDALQRAVALGQVEDEPDRLERLEPRGGAADQHPHARAVLAEVLLLPRRHALAPPQAAHRELVARRMLGRRHHRPVEPTGGEVLARVADHAQERVIGLDDAFGVGDRDPDDVRVEEGAEQGLAVRQAGREARRNADRGHA